MKIDVKELNLQICDLLDSDIREKSKEGLHNLLGGIRDKLMVEKSLDIKEEIIDSLEGHTTLRKDIKDTIPLFDVCKETVDKAIGTGIISENKYGKKIWVKE